MNQLTDRQKLIATLVKEKGPVSNKELTMLLAQKGEAISRITLIRDLNELLAAGEIRQMAQGRSTSYEHVSVHPLFLDIDMKKYLEGSERISSSVPLLFNHSVLEKFHALFNKQELENMQKINDEYRLRIQSLSPAILKKEMERVTIELSWKSSRIEGNTYSLIDTEMLIKEHKEAQGHSKEEAVMILNHKRALDYIFANKETFKTLTVRNVENVHRLLVEGLDVRHGIRQSPVGITGTNYRPLDNQHQIHEVIKKAVQSINGLTDGWSKALASLLLISYIQPFEDGNKRTSRLIANACLVSHEICPLSYRSVDEAEYKNALILFYELQNALPMKHIFIEQFNFAIRNYFR